MVGHKLHYDKLKKVVAIFTCVTQLLHSNTNLKSYTQSIGREKNPGTSLRESSHRDQRPSTLESISVYAARTRFTTRVNEELIRLSESYKNQKGQQMIRQFTNVHLRKPEEQVNLPKHFNTYYI